MTEAQARAAGLTEEQIAALTLDSGSHTSPESGMCLLEATAIFANEPFGDHPSCVDGVLGAMGRSWNDMLPDAERQQLKKYIPLLPGTNGGPALSAQRSFMALDWVIRVHFPMWLEQIPELAEHAAQLRALAPITIQLGEAERTIAIATASNAAWAARAAWDAWDARAAWDAWAARAAWAAWAAWDARAARDAWDAWAARAAWAARDAWDAWAARDAWDAWAARDAWDAWDAVEAVSLTVAYEASKGCANYEEARAKADAVFASHRDEVREQMHALYLEIINAKLDEAAALDRADQI
jgi:hypothetical protein